MVRPSASVKWRALKRRARVPTAARSVSPAGVRASAAAPPPPSPCPPSLSAAREAGRPAPLERRPRPPLGASPAAAPAAPGPGASAAVVAGATAASCATACTTPSLRNWGPIVSGSFSIRISAICGGAGMAGYWDRGGGRGAVSSARGAAFPCRIVACLPACPAAPRAAPAARSPSPARLHAKGDDRGVAGAQQRGQQRGHGQPRQQRGQRVGGVVVQHARQRGQALALDLRRHAGPKHLRGAATEGGRGQGLGAREGGRESCRRRQEDAGREAGAG